MKKFLLLLVVLVMYTISIFSQWEKANNGIERTYINSILSKDNYLFVGSVYSPQLGLFLSTDNGITWKQNGLNDKQITSLTINDNFIFTGTLGCGVYLSSDNGFNWNVANNGLTTGYDSLIVCMNKYNNTILLGTENGIFISIDNAKSWTRSDLTGVYIRSLTSCGKKNFAATYNEGLYRSSDNGLTWNKLDQIFIDTLINSFCVYKNEIFACSEHGIFLSTDEGNTWKPINAGLPTLFVESLAIFDTNIFAGTAYHGVYMSTDFGKHWIPKNKGIENFTVISLTVNDTFIFAGIRTINEAYDGIGIYRAKLSDLIRLDVGNNPNKENFSLFPNPVSDYLNLSFPNNNSSEIKIYNELGIPVFEKKVQDEKNFKIDTRDYPPGVYFCQIKAGSSAETKKFIVVK